MWHHHEASVRSAAAAAVAVALALDRDRLWRRGGHRRRQAEGRRRTTKALPTYTVAKDVKVDSPALKKAQKRGKIVIGAKADQPYLGFEDTDRQALRLRHRDRQDGRRRPRLLRRSRSSSRRSTPTSARPPSPRARSTSTSAPTRSTTSARSRSASRARTSWPAPDLLVRKDEKAHQGPGQPQGQEGLLDRRLDPARRRSRSRSTAPRPPSSSKYSRVRQAAARRPGRRGHHRRRDPQGLRGPASGEAQGRRQAVHRGALRHRHEQGRQGAARRGARRHRGAPARTATTRRPTTRRSAGPAPSSPSRRPSSVLTRRCPADRAACRLAPCAPPVRRVRSGTPLTSTADRPRRHPMNVLLDHLAPVPRGIPRNARR